MSDEKGFVLVINEMGHEVLVDARPPGDQISAAQYVVVRDGARLSMRKPGAAPLVSVTLQFADGTSRTELLL